MLHATDMARLTGNVTDFGCPEKDGGASNVCHEGIGHERWVIIPYRVNEALN
jgi:hypothetical protein